MRRDQEADASRSQGDSRDGRLIFAGVGDLVPVLVEVLGVEFGVVVAVVAFGAQIERRLHAEPMKFSPGVDFFLPAVSLRQTSRSSSECFPPGPWQFSHC